MKQCKVGMDQENIISTFASTQFYGDPDAYIREFLQNAIDACNTRAALEWSWGTEFLEMEEARALNSMRNPYSPQISIQYNSETQRLVFEDNGIGINARDIEQYVAKIGVSFYQSEDFSTQQLHYEPVAQFGVGMLSGFMVARALLIESRKDKSVNTAWNVTDRQTLEPVTAKWIEGAETMEYINSNREQSGTRITLVLRPKYAKNLSLQRLVHAVQHYMLYQPFPIQISFDEKSVTLREQNHIMDNPFADILGIISIRIMDELMEGCIWIYNSKHQELIGTSCLYQQGFLVTDEKKDLGLKPEWLRHMTYHLHLRKKFLTLRLARDDVAHDENLTELRRLIGRRIVEHFASNPLGLNQYIASGQQPVLTEYEEEMQLLGKAVTVEVYLKGREIELPVATIIQGYTGKSIRIAFISKGLFTYYRQNHIMDFRRFLAEYQLIVFEKNRDLFCQLLAPYQGSMHYVISSECPGVIYEEMDADFHMIKSVVPYRYQYHLRPETFPDNEIFCMVTNTANGTLELRVNPKHRLLRILEPVMYHPKVHRMMEVIYENIKQRVINTQHRWNKIVDFGGSFVDDWKNQENVPTVSCIWCLEGDFDVSVNEFIAQTLTQKERVDLGLVGLVFRRQDFIDWWFAPRE